MKKHILFPTDFSANAENALNYALYLTLACDGKITIMNAYYAVTNDAMLNTSMMETMVAQAQAYSKMELQKLKEQLLAKYPGLAIETRSEFGFTSDSIIGAARELHTDYIVMGTKGASNLIDEMLGSNTVAVFDKAPCPVWAIPSTAKNSDINAVVYSSDYDGNDKKTIDEALAFAGIFKAHLDIVHIIEENEPNLFKVDEYTQTLRKAYEGQAVSFRNLHRKDLESGLIHYAENKKADVIVVARQERGFLENLFHRSATKHFLLRSEVPILALKKF